MDLFSDTIPQPQVVEVDKQRPTIQGSVYSGDALKILDKIPEKSAQMCVTSPPYWGLRDYGVEGQLGAEMDVKEYVQKLVQIFDKVSKILKDDGTLWLNIGDSYTSGGRKWRQTDKKNPARGMDYRAPTPAGLKPKDLIGVPWRVAFALQDAGWYLRSDIIWHKPNGLPESVKDRPTRVHEYLFLFSKSKQYFYDWDAVRQPTKDGQRMRSLRSVWNINTEPFPEAHFAVYPSSLIIPCIKAGSTVGDIVLDPFFGAGTTGLACAAERRNFVGVELNSDYLDIGIRRISPLSGVDLKIHR